jgi:hypothetical protein
MLLAALASTPAAGTARAATNEIRFCGRGGGYVITAGNFPAGGIPRTRCSFARATFRRVRARDVIRAGTRRFRLRVRGQRLRCRQNRAHTIRCRNPRRFVLLYRTG